jgi:hypothetical protein
VNDNSIVDDERKRRKSRYDAMYNINKHITTVGTPMGSAISQASSAGSTDQLV